MSLLLLLLVTEAAPVLFDDVVVAWAMYESGLVDLRGIGVASVTVWRWEEGVGDGLLEASLGVRVFRFAKVGI